MAVNRLFLTVPCLAMTGCVIGGDKWPRPRDLAPSWLVDRTRILAVAANPPEIAPGETATFEALIPDPGGEGDLSRLWFACPEVDGGFGCNLDLSTGSGTTATGTGTDGFIGLEPFIPPVYTAPDDLLDGITDLGWRVNRVVGYRTADAEPSADEVDAARRADAITFTSSSTVERFVRLAGVDAVPPVVISIGPITSATAADLGLSVTAEADPHTLDGLVDAVVDWATGGRPQS